MKVQQMRRLAGVVFEYTDGVVACEQCDMSTCEHVVACLKARTDSIGYDLPPEVSVPLFGPPTPFSVPVELDEANHHGMRPARLFLGQSYPNVRLGHLAPGEGRWALRDLVLAELISLHGSSACKIACKYSSQRSAESAMGVADTWSVHVNGYCYQHWNEIQAAKHDDDLIPVV